MLDFSRGDLIEQFFLAGMVTKKSRVPDGSSSCNFADGDLFEGFLIQQMQKRFADRSPCLVDTGVGGGGVVSSINFTLRHLKQLPLIF